MKNLLTFIFCVTWIVFSVDVAFSSTYVIDYTGDIDGGRTYEQFIVGTNYPVSFGVSDFADFSIADGSLFNLTISHKGNSTGRDDNWAVYFSPDINTTSFSMIEELQYSYLSWVDDSLNIAFDLSGDSWGFQIREVGDDEGAGIKINEVVLSHVPITGSIWLFSSSLIGILGLRRNFKK